MDYVQLHTKLLKTRIQSKEILILTRWMTIYHQKSLLRHLKKIKQATCLTLSSMQI